MQLSLFDLSAPKKAARASSKLPVHAASSVRHWQTPQFILERAIDVLGGIDLDPCSNSKYAPEAPARVQYTLEEDGLARPWQGRVWMNPPHGRAMVRWIDKLCAEYESGGVTAGIALLPSRTDTQWFKRLTRYPICLIHGRLRFSGQKNNAPFPSAVVYLGPLLSRFAGTFGAMGAVYTPFGVSDLPPSPIWGGGRL
jgi:hypothetical protein